MDPLLQPEELPEFGALRPMLNWYQVRCSVPALAAEMPARHQIVDRHLDHLAVVAAVVAQTASQARRV
jgi:hypothetical protein